MLCGPLLAPAASHHIRPDIHTSSCCPGTTARLLPGRRLTAGSWPWRRLLRQRLVVYVRYLPCAGVPVHTMPVQRCRELVDQLLRRLQPCLGLLQCSSSCRLCLSIVGKRSHVATQLRNRLLRCRNQLLRLEHEIHLLLQLLLLMLLLLLGPSSQFLRVQVG